MTDLGHVLTELQPKLRQFLDRVAIKRPSSVETVVEQILVSTVLNMCDVRERLQAAVRRRTPNERRLWTSSPR